MLDELVAVVEALDALAAVDPAELANNESVLELQRQRFRLEAIGEATCPDARVAPVEKVNEHLEKLGQRRPGGEGGHHG